MRLNITQIEKQPKLLSFLQVSQTNVSSTTKPAVIEQKQFEYFSLSQIFSTKTLEADINNKTNQVKTEKGRENISDDSKHTFFKYKDAEAFKKYHLHLNLRI